MPVDTENLRADASAGHGSVESDEWLSEAGLVVHQRALIRSAVNCATYIRFSYPLWIRVLTVVSSLMLVLTLVFVVLLLAGNPDKFVFRVDVSTGLFVSAVASFVGFLTLTIAGHAAERFSTTVREWHRYLNLADKIRAMT